MEWRRSYYFFLFCFCIPLSTQSFVQGIYVTQPTMEYASKVRSLIQNATAGIDAFVVDYTQKNTRYRKNIALLKQNHIRYVAQIVMFPNNGASPTEIQYSAYMEKRYCQIRGAVA